LDPNQNLACLRRRDRTALDLQDFRPAGFVDNSSLHRVHGSVPLEARRRPFDAASPVTFAADLLCESSSVQSSRRRRSSGTKKLLVRFRTLGAACLGLLRPAEFVRANTQSGTIWRISAISN